MVIQPEGYLAHYGHMRCPGGAEDYLAHIGRSKKDGAKIGSGRFRLGSGERPLQGEPDSVRNKYLNEGGHLTAMGRIHYGLAKAKENAESRHKAELKAHKDEIADAVASGKSTEEINALIDMYGKRALTKKAIMSSNDPDFIYEHRKKLTDSDLDKVMNRIHKEAELKKLVDSNKIEQNDRNKELEKSMPKDTRYDEAQKEAEAQRITKESVLNSADPKEILKYSSQLTTDELQAAYNRIQKVQQLQALTVPQVQKQDPTLMRRAAKYIGDAAIDALAKTTGAAVKGAIAYEGQKIVEKALADHATARSYIVGAMKGNANSQKQNNNQNQNQQQNKK